MRNPGNYGAAALAVFFASIAAGACTYDFDALVSQTGAGATGGAGPGGSSGSGGTGGTIDAGGDDGTGSGGTAGSGRDGAGGTSGSGGSGGSGGKGGTGGTPTDAGKGGTSSDASTDRASDVRDATAETAPFDCAAVNGTVFQGHCYYPNLTETTWDVARSTGCAPPSHLAVIRSQAEHNIVAPMLAGKQRWIGLRKRANSPNVESSFEWVTQETLGSYKPWETYEAGANEPNYTGECVRLQPTTNNWADAPCTETKPAICEHE